MARFDFPPLRRSGPAATLVAPFFQRVSHEKTFWMPPPCPKRGFCSSSGSGSAGQPIVPAAKLPERSSGVSQRKHRIVYSPLKPSSAPPRGRGLETLTSLDHLLAEGRRTPNPDSLWKRPRFWRKALFQGPERAIPRGWGINAPRCRGSIGSAQSRK